MNLLDLKKQLKNLNSCIISVLHDSGFEKDSQLILDDFDNLNADELQLYYEYENIFDKLDIISERLLYLSKSITHKGKLYRTSDDRFAVDGCELCCGYHIEVLEYDDYYECYRWVIGRIEYSDSKGGYYLYGHDIPLTEGMTVRLR